MLARNVFGQALLLFVLIHIARPVILNVVNQRSTPAGAKVKNLERAGRKDASALLSMTGCVVRCFALPGMTFGYTNFIPLERANKQLSLFFLTPTPFGYLPLAKLLAFVVQLQTSLHCTHLLATFLFQKRKSFYHAQEENCPSLKRGTSNEVAEGVQKAKFIQSA